MVYLQWSQIISNVSCPSIIGIYILYIYIYQIIHIYIYLFISYIYYNILYYITLYYITLYSITLYYIILCYIILCYLNNTVFKKCPPKMISNDFIVTKARAAFSSCRVSSRASAKAYDKVWSTSKAVQSWCHSRNIVATYTSDSDWTSNGRAENEIGMAT